VGFRCREAFHSTLHDQSVDTAFFILGPNNGHIRKGRIRNPKFGSVEQEVIAFVLELGFHAPRIGSVVGLGQSKTTHPLTTGQFRQVLLALLFCSVSENGVHHQGGLNGSGGAHSGIPAFNFLHDQSVTDLVQSGSTVLLRDIGTKSPDLRQASDDLRWKFRLLCVLLNDGRNIALYPGSGRIANQFVFLTQEVIQEVIIRGFKQISFHLRKFSLR